MPIRQLDIQGVRNLAPISLTADPAVNFIYGDNGSGKTSVLEAIALLSSGRSFRTHQFKYLVSFDSDRIQLGAELSSGRVFESLKMKNGDQLVRLDGKLVSTRAEVASLLPVQIIEPGSFRLLVGSPEDRRQFLDWGVFYFDDDFMPLWRNLKKLLKQRNRALKDKDETMLSLWEQAYIEAAVSIDASRSRYFSELSDCFYSIIDKLDPTIEDLKLDYFRGWDRHSELEDVLLKQRERDMVVGFTQSGPHRAELRITSKKIPASDSLSRGQQKSVVSALKLAQGHVFKTSTGESPIYLVDDLASELDTEHRLALCQLLEQLECQVFITSIERQQLLDTWAPRSYKVFHVEQGQIAERTLAD